MSEGSKPFPFALKLLIFSKICLRAHCNRSFSPCCGGPLISDNSLSLIKVTNSKYLNIFKFTFGMFKKIFLNTSFILLFHFSSSEIPVMCTLIFLYLSVFHSHHIVLISFKISLSQFHSLVVLFTFFNVSFFFFVTRTLRIYSWQISFVSYGRVSCSHHVVHYSPTTDLFYNWKLAPFDCLPEIPLPLPSTSGNHKSDLFCMSLAVLCVCVCECVF